MTWLVRGFALVYAAALALFAWSVFGQQQASLGAIYLVPLGLPWNLLAMKLGLTETGGPAVAVLAPLVNLLLLAGLARMIALRRRA